VREAAELLEMDHLLDRYPKQLSGDRRSAVAVGRAIVKRPEVFLFDEPLSNLDAKLRASMRVRLTELHRTLREQGRPSTVVYVTHDQVEAMTMGERICVLKDGEIQQVDTPTAVYDKPANVFCGWLHWFTGDEHHPCRSHPRWRASLHRPAVTLQVPQKHDSPPPSTEGGQVRYPS